MSLNLVFFLRDVHHSSFLLGFFDLGSWSRGRCGYFFGFNLLRLYFFGFCLLGLYFLGLFLDFLTSQSWGFSLLDLSSLLGSPSVINLLIFFIKSNTSLPSPDSVFLVDSLSSQSDFSDQSLDLGSFVSTGIGAFLALESSSDGVFLDQGSWALSGLFSFDSFDSVEFSDTSSSFGTKSSGFGLISQSWNLFLSLLDNSNRKHFDVRTYNTSSDRSSLSFSSTLGSVSFWSRLE